MLGKTILVLLSAALAATLMVFLLLWKQLQQVRRYCRQLNTAIQRLDRDLTQQRYALASMRRKGSDDSLEEEPLVADEDVMDLAFSHVGASDDATAALPEKSVALDDMKPAQVLQFLKKAIKNDEIAVSLQPIVKLPQRTPSFYEVFARIKTEGGYISAGQFVSIARDNNLMSALDNLLLLRCLQIVKNKVQKEPNAAFFINISINTLANKTYVTDLVNFLSDNPKLSSRLIFEITQNDSLKTSVGIKQIIEGLALLGCRFSMDQVTMLGLDVDRLVDQNISFVKLDARMIVDEMQHTDRRGRLRKLKNLLEASGITVILEKIENERQLLNVIDLYVDYAQGYLFGYPQDIV